MDSQLGAKADPSLLLGRQRRTRCFWDNKEEQSNNVTEDRLELGARRRKESVAGITDTIGRT